MEEFDILSQLAIATAGFAALASLLKPKQAEIDLDHKLNVIRFYVMIEFALTVVVFSFLPFVLRGFVNEEANFRVSSGVAFLFCVIMARFAFQRNKKLVGKAQVGDFHAKLSRLLSLLAILLFLANTAGLTDPFFYQSYLTSLFLLFILSLDLFYRLIIRTVKPENMDS